ncbi:helix-turn-helix domain-containing protein [Pseudonocardia sp. NPDC049154]|uniref:winged helix-turn-helix transcriptional regulator n=1 Tax=Pseudonocardia sp. NPDC049154 TaxID=3155501 RepID=UPI0033F52D82
MERKSFQDMDCPVALALERVGEWWSILILRDATHGITKFDEFQRSLGISPNSLSRRLGALVHAGLLERRRYSERPPRDEYVLTEAGRAFRPVLIALYQWGGQFCPPEQPNVRLVMDETGEEMDPVYIDRKTGHPLDEEHTTFLPGPTASDQLRAVLARREDQSRTRVS